MKFSKSLSFLGAWLLSSAAVAQTPLLEDDFESGDLTTSGPTDFRWGGSDKSADDTNKSVHIAPLDSGRPGTKGERALHFRYSAGSNWAEKRYHLGEPAPELWIRYWIRVPENYEHSERKPSNMKLSALWMDGYSTKGDGPTVAWEMWNNGEKGSDLSFIYSVGENTGGNGHRQRSPFIEVPRDQGRWMQIVYHLKAASNRDAEDGVVETYRRWADEREFTKIHGKYDADIAPPPEGPNGWLRGYLMGWSNPSYDEDTVWVIDEVVMSDENLLELGSPPIAPAPSN